MRLLSGIVVVSFGLYLVGLGVVIALKPLVAKRFIESFASSARAHYTELALRLTVGAAIVVFAPSMWYPSLLEGFGRLIIITTVGLLLIPWQWHNKFAQWAIPLVIRHLKSYALSASALGAFILYSVSRAALS